MGPYGLPDDRSALKSGEESPNTLGARKRNKKRIAANGSRE